MSDYVLNSVRAEALHTALKMQWHKEHNGRRSYNDLQGITVRAIVVIMKFLP